MKVSSHGGHTPVVPGANFGGRKEHVMDREVNSKFITKLRALGHDVKDDTYEGGNTASQVVNAQVRNINSRKNDVGFSWHLNASNGEGHGVEVLCYSSKEAPTAAKISAEIAKRTGWKDRGAKIRPDIGVIRSTNCTVFLVECGFIDNSGDMDKWNSDAIAEAVIFAYFGQRTVSKESNSKEYAGKVEIDLGTVLQSGGTGWGASNDIAEALVLRGIKGRIEVQTDGLVYLVADNLNDLKLQELEYWVRFKGWSYSVNGTWKKPDGSLL